LASDRQERLYFFLNLTNQKKKKNLKREKISSTPDIDWDSLSFGIEHCAPVSRRRSRRRIWFVGEEREDEETKKKRT